MSEESKFYVLTKELTVPDPEGDLFRFPGTFGQPVTLKLGTHFQVDDGSLSVCGTWGALPSIEQAAVITPHLEPAEYRIGQSLEGDAESVIAALGELGIVTKEDMERVNDHLQASVKTQSDFTDLLNRNWIDWYPS